MASFFTMLRAIKRAVFGRGRRHVRGDQQAGRRGRPAAAAAAPRRCWRSASSRCPGAGGASASASATTCSGPRSPRSGRSTTWALVYAVVKMGLRPAQKRRVPRFRAHFPVEIPGHEGMVGMTGDISETGCTLLWSGNLPVGAHVPIEMHLGCPRMALTGIVRGRHGVRLQGWQAHGMEFEARTQAQRDLLNDAIFQFVVPSLFRELSVPVGPGAAVPADARAPAAQAPPPAPVHPRPHRRGRRQRGVPGDDDGREQRRRRVRVAASPCRRARRSRSRCSARAVRGRSRRWSGAARRCRPVTRSRVG